MLNRSNNVWVDLDLYVNTILSERSLSVCITIMKTLLQTLQSQI